MREIECFLEYIGINRIQGVKERVDVNEQTNEQLNEWMNEWMNSAWDNKERLMRPYCALRKIQKIQKIRPRTNQKLAVDEKKNICILRLGAFRPE